MIIKVTKQQLESRLKNRSPEYISEISPAIVSKYADGSIGFESEHPAWKAAMAKYRPVREATKSVKSVNPDRCPYAVRTCCGQPDSCSKTGGDCFDPLNKDCKLRD